MKIEKHLLGRITIRPILRSGLLSKKLIYGIGLMVLILAGTAGYLLRKDDSAKHPASIYPPMETYPEVHDLAPDAELDMKFASLSYGVHTFLWWNGTYRTWDLDNVRQMNFAYVKQSFSWANIEPVKGYYDWSLADEVVAEVLYRGRRLVARIDSVPEWAISAPENWEEAPFDVDSFGEFCGTLAARYQGQIEAYQIWNEPNLEREWGGYVPSPPGYVKLLAACSTAIREADPDAIVISAGLSPTGTRDEGAMPDEEYLWRMYEAGAAPYFDVLGLHAPGYKLPPEASEEETREAGLERWARFRHVEDMRAIMVANGDAEKQIAITEMGWTTDTRSDSIYAWFGVSQETQADYLARAYAYAAEYWRPWVGLVTVIYLSNDIWTPEDEQWWWAIDEPAAPGVWKQMRPAYYALSNMEKLSTNPEFSEPARDPNAGYYLEPLTDRD
ncbi:MAG: beta-galactosidase [Anaerolineae bacterium]|nr:beta-galactosidase [Anaerolineae bacterium]